MFGSPPVKLKIILGTIRILEVHAYLLDKSSISSSVMNRLDRKILEPDDSCVLMLTDSLLTAGAMTFSVMVVVVAVGRLSFKLGPDWSYLP